MINHVKPGLREEEFALCMDGGEFSEIIREALR